MKTDAGARGPLQRPVRPANLECPSKLGKAQALAALAHKLGRAFYHRLHTKEAFDIDRFVRP